jgi:hypothetical protein
MATYMTQFPGNTALQTAVWTLATAEAKAAIPLLNTTGGSDGESHLLKPSRRAVRAKKPTVTV